MAIIVRKWTALLLTAYFTHATAGSIKHKAPPQYPTSYLPWSIIASFGYGQHKNMFKNDGQSALGRLAFQKTFFNHKSLAAGLELGVQSGNRARLDVTQSDLDILAGLPIQTTIKPMLDLLFVASFQPSVSSSMRVVVKGGAAFRRWQFDRDTINDVAEINGELQAGVSYPINTSIYIDLFYQGIFDSDPTIEINSLTQTAHISHIPIQNSVFLGIKIELDKVGQA